MPKISQNSNNENPSVPDLNTAKYFFWNIVNQLALIIHYFTLPDISSGTGTEYGYGVRVRVRKEIGNA